MELEPGPLAPLDPGALFTPRVEHTFEELLARLVADVGGAGVALETAERTIADASSPAGVDAEAQRTIDHAAAQLGDARRALDAVRPEALAELAGEHVAAVEARQREYDDALVEAPPEADDWNPDERPDRPPDRPPIPV